MLDSQIKIEIVTPRGLFFSEEVYMVTMPGIKGEFGVCSGHMPLVVGLQPGLIVVYNSKLEEKERFFVSSGFAQVNEEEAIILVEKAGYLADYNLKDTIQLLKDLKTASDLCQTDSEKAKIEKDIIVAKNLLAILER